MDTKFKETLGKQLRTIRCSRGLGQREVARCLGYSNNSWISLWESGKTVPSICTLIRLAILYDVSVDILVWENIKKEKIKCDTSPISSSMKW